MRQLKLSGNFWICGDARGVDGRNGAGKTDCRHSVRADGDAVNRAVVQERALDGIGAGAGRSRYTEAQAEDAANQRQFAFSEGSHI